MLPNVYIPVLRMVGALATVLGTVLSAYRGSNSHLTAADAILTSKAWPMMLLVLFGPSLSLRISGLGRLSEGKIFWMVQYSLLLTDFTGNAIALSAKGWPMAWYST